MDCNTDQILVGNGARRTVEPLGEPGADYLPHPGKGRERLADDSEEGYSVSCPALPGCWSQGASEAEALENIRSAIQEYLGVVEELLRDASEIEIRELEIAV